MSFRNDHDAALARVDALEARVEGLTAELEEERAEVRRLEAFIGLRDELEEPTLDIVGHAPPLLPDDPVGIMLAIAVLFAVGLFVLAVVMA